MAYLELGASPGDEQCAQVGAPDYREKSRKEGRRYKAQLERMFPIPEGLNCWFSIRGFGHDFGTYYEVVINFDDSIEEEINFAYHVENNLPANWEEEKPFIVKDGEVFFNPHCEGNEFIL